MQCIHHDYANLFFRHVLKELSAPSPSDSLVANRLNLALMIEIASGYLARLRWLEGAPVPRESSPSLMRNAGICTIETCVHEIDRLLSLCGVKAPPLTIEENSLALSREIFIAQNKEFSARWCST